MPARQQHPAGPVSTRSVNDQRVFNYMRGKIAELESKLRISEVELERLRARSAGPFNQRERFLLNQIDLICRQLQGWTLAASLLNFLMLVLF